jgi:tetratricopeptide (TPR) repeat protein
MRTMLAMVLGLWGMGCSVATVATPKPAVADVVPGVGSPERARFSQGLAAMTRHERDDDWTPAACADAVKLLLAGAPLAVASYDAGLVEQRCKHRAEAEAHFDTAIARDPAMFRARVGRAMLRADDAGGLDRAITEIAAVVRETRFGDADTLVALAMLQMRRGGATSDEDGDDDLDRARKNLQRALAIDDASVPAMNQLALNHLARARRANAHGAASRRSATQALELAVLVCTQGLAKSPRSAAIHNTLGLVEVELGNLSRAAAAFDEARHLDPHLVEAHMNLAALNLQVRGFARAEEAYRAVLALRRDDYDAHLGLALAIRGQIDAGTATERVASATRELEAAKRLAPERPEAYFNQAILVQEYGDPSVPAGDSLSNLSRAKGLYEQFLSKADGAAAFAPARDRARERLADIEQITLLVKSAPAVP